MSKKEITIATHSGSFHTDDIFAVAALELYLEKTKPGVEVDIVRTRKEREYESADFVVDVGSVYDPEKRRFDHHQKESAGERENGIPYAAFGLVWKEFGADIAGDPEVAEIVDSKLVQSIDAPDNGVALTGKARFDNVFPYFLGTAANAFKPTWREDDSGADERFEWLVDKAKVLLQREVKVAKDRLDGAKLVEEAYQQAEDKRLVWLDDNLPYRFTLLQHPEPLFVVYPKDSGRWRLRAVVGDNFDARAQLPEEWRGKRDRQLQEVTGIEDAIFCHKSLPMITTDTKESIAELAEKALAWQSESR